MSVTDKEHLVKTETNEIELELANQLLNVCLGEVSTSEWHTIKIIGTHVLHLLVDPKTNSPNLHVRFNTRKTITQSLSIT